MTIQNILYVYNDTKVVLEVPKTVQLLNKLNITIPNPETLTAHLFGTFFDSIKIISIQPTIKIIANFSRYLKHVLLFTKIEFIFSYLHISQSTIIFLNALNSVLTILIL